MTNSQRLLAEYAENGSESAFRELVTRYLNLVYAAALRLVNGDRQLAEDVTQMVFINLAKKGRTLSREVMLGGWLHQNTYHIATRTMRAERRRKSREREALEMNTLQDDSLAGWHQAAPILDEAITQLGTEDRTAILLRFFEQSDFRSVGEALGSNEDAARMRVSRALEKLHSLLKRRGVTLSIAALATTLAAEAATAAPAGLAVTISNIAMAGAAGTGTTLTLLKLMANTKLKLGLATLILAGAATTLVIQHQSQTKLREENQSFRRQIAELKADHESLTNVTAQEKKSAPLSADQFQELLRLRSEVGRLRQQTGELAGLQRQNQDLLSRVTEESGVTNQISEEDQFILRQTHAVEMMQTLLAALKNYSTNHNGQYPGNFDQLIASGNLTNSNFPGNLSLDDFEFETDDVLDMRSNKILLTLRVPISRPGLPSGLVRGAIDNHGVPLTEMINVSP